MGLFDEVGNLIKSNPDEVSSLTQDAEQYVDGQTGGQYSGEIQQAGSFADNYLEDGQQQ